MYIYSDVIFKNKGKSEHRHVRGSSTCPAHTRPQAQSLTLHKRGCVGRRKTRKRRERISKIIQQHYKRWRKALSLYLVSALPESRHKGQRLESTGPSWHHSPLPHSLRSLVQAVSPTSHKCYLVRDIASWNLLSDNLPIFYIRPF